MMPLPSATDPRFAKTQVVRVECFYLGGEPGTIELHNLHVFDFKEAATAHPEDWALVEAVETMPQFRPFRMPVGPHAPRVIDRRNIPNFPTSEQMSSVPPPMIAGDIRLHERTGPGGSPLFPRR